MGSSSKLLQDKTALITGAGRGIGRAIAETFAQSGANLFLNARKKGSLDDFCKDLSRQTGGTVTPLYFDVSAFDEVKDGFQQLIKLTKHLDVLVNNAGIMKDSVLGLINPALVNEVFGTNTFGALYVSQFASRLMMKDKKGSIINMTSITATEGSEGQTIYSGSKAALIGITKSAAKELAPYGIRVNAVAPGFIDTEMTKNLPEKRRQEVIKNIKMKRVGTPQDVANCCLFLASDLSEYMTGQVIGVDGGMRI